MLQIGVKNAESRSCLWLGNSYGYRWVISSLVWWSSWTQTKWVVNERVCHMQLKRWQQCMCMSFVCILLTRFIYTLWVHCFKLVILSSVLGQRYLPDDIRIRSLHNMQRHSSGVLCMCIFSASILLAQLRWWWYRTIYKRDANSGLRYYWLLTSSCI